MADLFGFLAGISPYWWLALGIALAGSEMLMPAFLLIWPGLAAIAVALLLWVVPDLSGHAQVVTFAGLSVATALAGRALIRRRGQPASDEPGLNRRSAGLIGRRGKVLRLVPPAEATVEIDGVPWPALWEGTMPEVGGTVRVVASEGVRLRVAVLPE